MKIFRRKKMNIIKTSIKDVLCKNPWESTNASYQSLLPTPQECSMCLKGSSDCLKRRCKEKMRFYNEQQKLRKMQALKQLAELEGSESYSCASPGTWLDNFTLPLRFRTPGSPGSPGPLVNNPQLFSPSTPKIKPPQKCGICVACTLPGPCTVGGFLISFILPHLSGVLDVSEGQLRLSQTSLQGEDKVQQWAAEAAKNAGFETACRVGGVRFSRVCFSRVRFSRYIIGWLDTNSYF